MTIYIDLNVCDILDSCFISEIFLVYYLFLFKSLCYIPRSFKTLDFVAVAIKL